jgi:hypothetical protein
MGKIINAICKNCGFNKDFPFGGCKADYKEVQMVPAIKKINGEFSIVNILNKNDNVDNYDYYHKSELQASRDMDTINSFDIKLKKEQNICPICRSFSLYFNIVMFTD